jgi:two-component system, OmpR family, response regulator
MWRVLVVDDDLCVLQVAKTILERSGFTTLYANNGVEALTLLQTHYIDVLLIDIAIPAMSGTELILEARKRQPNLSVCCMTAYVPLLDRDLKQEFIMAKPFAPRDLINAVQHVLQARPARRDQVGASSSCSLPIQVDQIPKAQTLVR